MKHIYTGILGLIIFLSAPNEIMADVIVMASGTNLSGTAIQTNGDDVLVLAQYAAFNFSKKSILEIRPTPLEDLPVNGSRLPSFQKTLFLLSKQPWAVNLTPIPATVVDLGILRNVPYTSFRSGDYEINIYGEMENPAGIEVGVYRKLLNDDVAKSNCVKFISDVLNEPADKEILQILNRQKDLISRNGLTFEITPPTDEDSYNGWWISVYSEKQLNLARASESEMRSISVAQAGAEKNAIVSTNFSSWSDSELKQARPASKRKITFINKSGATIRNAEVIRINEGVSLIWRSSDGNGSGLVKLADLPEALQKEFGYDEAKSRIAEEQDKANKERWKQEALAAQAAQSAASPSYDSGYSSDDYSNVGYSGGSVYVHGYYRSNGTYVNAYTRRR